MTDIPAMPDIPHATDAATKRVHRGIELLTKRIAVKALSQNHDILFAVYCAGLFHGQQISAAQTLKERSDV